LSFSSHKNSSGKKSSFHYIKTLTMMFRSLFLLVLCSSTAATTIASNSDAQEQSNVANTNDIELDNNVPEGKLFLSEEFLSFEETVARVREQGNSFLRRGLQSSPACRARSPLNVPRPEGQYCSQLAKYPCSCTGISETTCNYCALRPDTSGISCQVSGSLITFMDHTNTVTTCGCEYLGNGQVHQYCYQESGPVPIPPPAVVVEPPPVAAPIAPRAPFGPTVPVPSVPAPTTGGGGGGKGSGKGKGGSKKM